MELYHFCSLESFFSIFNMENPSLRLVYSYRVNDYFENKWFFKIMSDAIKETGETETVKSYLSQIDRYNVLFNHLFATYIASFSNADIKLPLWREYANNGKGIAIVFKSDEVEKELNRLNEESKKKQYRLEKVIYHYIEQKDIVINFLMNNENRNKI